MVFVKFIGIHAEYDRIDAEKVESATADKLRSYFEAVIFSMNIGSPRST